jgi:hypothetical protein
MEEEESSVSPAARCVAWQFSRDENVRELDRRTFSYLITEREHVEGFHVVHAQNSYRGFSFTGRGLRMRQSLDVFVHMRDDFALIS